MKIVKEPNKVDLPKKGKSIILTEEYRRNLGLQFAAHNEKIKKQKNTNNENSISK